MREAGLTYLLEVMYGACALWQSQQTSTIHPGHSSPHFKQDVGHTCMHVYRDPVCVCSCVCMCVCVCVCVTVIYVLCCSEWCKSKLWTAVTLATKSLLRTKATDAMLCVTVHNIFLLCIYSSKTGRSSQPQTNTNIMNPLERLASQWAVFILPYSACMYLAYTEQRGTTKILTLLVM